MHTKTHAHVWHRPHAEVLIPRPTIYAQICIHIHIHRCITHRCTNTYTHAYTYKHTCPHTYTHTHIHICTHTYKMYIWNARKHAWNDGAAAYVQGAVTDQGSSCTLFQVFFPSRIFPSCLERSRTLCLFHSISCSLSLPPPLRLRICLSIQLLVVLSNLLYVSVWVLSAWVPELLSSVCVFLCLWFCLYARSLSLSLSFSFWLSLFLSFCLSGSLSFF